LKKLLSLSSIDKVHIKRIPTKIIFRENIPFLLTANNYLLELSCFDAVVWIATCSEKTIKDIYDSVLTKYNLVFSSEELFENIIKSLKRFYQNGLISLEDNNRVV